ncbi:MAG: hypothetical protein ACI9HE_002146 [Planctomycetota bacterium]|jgi:hypothetical protein
MHSQDSILSTRLLASLLLSTFLFTGCEEGDDEGTGAQIFVIHTTSPAVSAGTPLEVSRNQMAFLGSEINTGSGGTNWNVDNGDVDKADNIVFMGNMDTDVVRNLKTAVDPAVATSRVIAFVNGTLFIAVSEVADTRMWNADMDMTDRVLCYVQPGDTEPTYLADLDPGANTPFVATANQLVFQTLDAAPGSGRTNLYRTEVATLGALPSTPSQVGTAFSTDVGNNGLECHLSGVSGNLISMTLDETVEGELNDDGEALDLYALCLLDGADNAALVAVTEITVRSASDPVRATFTGGDYLVGFLADEVSMGVNLNDPALLGGSWQPTQCTGLDDIDELDRVLHWLRLDDFMADPVTFPVVNTGLVSAGSVFVLGDNWVGTVSREGDEGTGTGCDLNADANFDDLVFRWIQAQPGMVPPGDSNLLHSIESSLPGGSGGIIELDGDVWVAAVDESADGRDLNGDMVQDRTLIGLLNPAVSAPFNFDMGSSVFVEPSWMAPDQRTPSRFLMALTERSLGIDSNNDGDMSDSIPTFPFEAAARELDFPGVSVALSANNAGIITAGGYGFYRASESSHEIDYNNDNDMLDLVLMRIRLSGGEAPRYMGLSSPLNQPVVQPGTEINARGIVWIAFEPQQGPSGGDLNGDGDSNDYVVRYTKLP